MDKLLNFFLKPKVWFAWLWVAVSVIVIAGTVVLAALQIFDFWVYIIFVVAFVVLSYLVYLIVLFAPKIKQKCMDSAMKNKHFRKYIQNFGYRSLVSTSVSFAINVAYAVGMAVLAILGQSIWYGALALYYVSLSCIKAGILIKYNKRKGIEDEKQFLIDQIKSYGRCGWYLVALTVALSGAVAQMVVTNQGFEYAGIMIYVMATYTFYKLTMSIVNFVKARGNHDHTIQSIRNLNLASALVSLLALQTALLQAFGQGVDPTLANALSGAGVAMLIVALGIVMIAGSARKIKLLKEK